MLKEDARFKDTSNTPQHHLILHDAKKNLDKLPWIWAMTLHVAHKMYSNVLFMAFHVYLYLQSVKNGPSFPTVSGKS